MLSKKQLTILAAIGGAALVLVISMIVSIMPDKDDGALTVTRKGVPIATLEAKASDPVLGKRSADITIFVFSDFGCTHCSSMPAILNQIVEKHKNVRVVWKDIPATQFPSPSEPAHIAARCAQQQKKFWEYHDVLFANNSQLNEAIFLQIANELGLKEKKFRTCMNEKQTKPLVDANIELAQLLAMDGTPFFMIGTERFSGVRTLGFFEEVVERQAARK